LHSKCLHFSRHSVLFKGMHETISYVNLFVNSEGNT
jgi:hypothetical protein